MAVKNTIRSMNGLNLDDVELEKKDFDHRIYLCQYNVIHVIWGEHNLVFCPGDFMGLPFLFASLKSRCNLECIQGVECPNNDDGSVVYLQYGSVQIPLTSKECWELHAAIKKAAARLFSLDREGYFSNP